MSRRNWKAYKPSSLLLALRACKDFALDKKRLTVERIADLMGVTHDALYKWLSTGRMPAVSIPTYEAICGCHFVSDWLANSAGRMVIEIPTGRIAGAEDLHELQTKLHDAVGTLLRFYQERAGADETQAALMVGMEGLAWHHTNVGKFEQPELAFDPE